MELSYYSGQAKLVLVDIHMRLRSFHRATHAEAVDSRLPKHQSHARPPEACWRLLLSV